MENVIPIDILEMEQKLIEQMVILLLADQPNGGIRLARCYKRAVEEYEKLTRPGATG